jgi:Cu/Ag efflux pump CusA
MMKKIIVILLLSTGFWACNNSETAAKKEGAAATEADHHEHADNKTGLELNNGAKWIADSSTNNNVKNLQVILEKFEAGADQSMAAYKLVADDLQMGLNKMVSECKMKGPDHDALHKWLEPLIAQVKELKKVFSEADASKLLTAIHTQVSYYYQYFE